MIRAYVGLGSNLATPIAQLDRALTAMDSLPNSHISCTSSFYASKPMGPSDQPDYVNAVTEIQTHLSAQQLLEHLQAIELTQGRERKGQRWGPRTLDLDILLFGDLVCRTPQLTIPHYGMAEREFVLYPLFEIAPELVLPDGRSLHSMLADCALNGLQKIAKP